MFTTHLVYVSDVPLSPPSFFCAGTLFVNALLQISFHISNLIKALLKLYTQKRKNTFRNPRILKDINVPDKHAAKIQMSFSVEDADLFILMEFTSAAVFFSHSESVEISGISGVVCHCPL